MSTRLETIDHGLVVYSLAAIQPVDVARSINLTRSLNYKTIHMKSHDPRTILEDSYLFNESPNLYIPYKHPPRSWAL